MEEKLIPDYSKYDIDLLVDAYTHLDRVSSPLESKILDDELKKRFNLEPEPEINPKVVMGFINVLQSNKDKTKFESAKYLKMIKQGAIVGFILSSLALLSWTIKMAGNYSGIGSNNVSVYESINLLLFFVLSYGILKQSRASALILTIYFILLKLYQISVSPISFKIFAVISLFAFSPFLVKAIIGSFKLHNNNLASLPIEKESVVICPVCGAKNHIANYNCHCGNILKPV
jgi:hypothetical protein